MENNNIMHVVYVCVWKHQAKKKIEEGGKERVWDAEIRLGMMKEEEKKQRKSRKKKKKRNSRKTNKKWERKGRRR